VLRYSSHANYCRPCRRSAGPDEEFAAGQACFFALSIDVTVTTRVNKTFEGADGSVRSLSAGTGSRCAH